MADITVNEMRDLLRDLGAGLHNTAGDKATYTKLEDIRKILASMQTQSLKNDPKILGSIIGRSIAEVLSRQGHGQAASAQNVHVDLIDDSVRLARRELVNELHTLSRAFTTTRTSLANFSTLTIPPGGGPARPGAAGSAPSFDEATASVSKLAVVAKAVQATAQGIVAASREIANTLLQNVDTYRRLSNLGQTFGGSLIEMRDTANSGGMRLDTFAKALETGSSGLRQLGGRDFASVSLSLRDSMRDYANMGMTVEGVNSTLSDYAEGLKYSGDLNQVRGANFNRQFQDMIVQTTNLSGAFGVARDQIIKSAADLKKDGDMNILLAGMSTENADFLRANHAALAANSPQAAKLDEDALAASMGTFTKSYGEAMASNPEMVKALTEAHAALNSGAIDRQEFMRLQQQAGEIGNRENRQRGNQQFLYGVQGNSAIDARKNSIASAGVFSSIRVNADGNALYNPDTITRETSKFDETMNRAGALYEKSITTLVASFPETIGGMFGAVNDLADKYISTLNGMLDSTRGSFSSLDQSIADFMKRIGPEATVGVGAGVVGLASLGSLVGLGVTAKSFLGKVGGFFSGGAGAGAGAGAEAGTAALAGEAGTAALAGEAGTAAVVGGAEVAAGGAAATAGGGALAVAAPIIAVAATEMAATYATKRLITEWGPLKSFVSAVDRAVPFLAKLDAATGMSNFAMTAGGEEYGPPMPPSAPANGEATQPALPANAAITAGGEEYGPGNPTAPITDPAVQTAASLQSMVDLMLKQLDLSNQMHQETLDQRQMINDIFRSINDNTSDTARNIRRIGHV